MEFVWNDEDADIGFYECRLMDKAIEDLTKRKERMDNLLILGYTGNYEGKEEK